MALLGDMAMTKGQNGTSGGAGAEVAKGIFEVDTLPEADATLLLVFGKRDDDSMQATFTSAAFPALPGGSVDAQVAVVNVDAAADSGSKLRLEEREPKRVEVLPFGTIYAMAAGNYELSVSAPASRKGAADNATQSPHEQVAVNYNARFEGGKHYIVLRTGAGAGHTSSLVVFPDENAINNEGTYGIGRNYIPGVLILFLGILVLGTVTMGKAQAAPPAMFWPSPTVLQAPAGLATYERAGPASSSAGAPAGAESASSSSGSYTRGGSASSSSGAASSSR